MISQLLICVQKLAGSVVEPYIITDGVTSSVSAKTASKVRPNGLTEERLVANPIASAFAPFRPFLIFHLAETLYILLASSIGKETSGFLCVCLLRASDAADLCCLFQVYIFKIEPKQLSILSELRGKKVTILPHL